MGWTAFFPDYLYASIYHLSSHILYLQNWTFRWKVCTRLQKIGRLLQEEQSKWHAIQTWANAIWTHFSLQFFRFVGAEEVSVIRPRFLILDPNLTIAYVLNILHHIQRLSCPTALVRINFMQSSSRLKLSGLMLTCNMDYGTLLEYISSIYISFATTTLSHNWFFKLVKRLCKWKMLQKMARESWTTQNSLKGSWGRCSESKMSHMLNAGFAHKLCYSRGRLLTPLGSLTVRT